MGWTWLWVVLVLLGLWSLVAFLVTWIVGPRRREVPAEVLERQPADSDMTTSEQDRRRRHLPRKQPIALNKEAPE